jgi:hypothetical protein
MWRLFLRVYPWLVHRFFLVLKVPPGLFVICLFLSTCLHAGGPGGDGRTAG